MHRPAVFLAGILVLTATAAFASEGTFDKTLSVNGSPNVSVSTGSGYVHVFPGNDTQVHIIGHVHARTGLFGGDSDDKVRAIVADPPIVQSGSIVTVGGNHGQSNLFQNVSIDYDVTVPRLTTLKANSGSGDLRIGGIAGIVTAESGSGRIDVDDIGANARIQTGSGSIHANNVRGAANLQTGSGGLDLDVSGAGDVTARSGSGSIHIHGINGGLRASTGSGGIEAGGTPTAEWRLQTGSGGIHISLNNTPKFTVRADTGSGTVHIDKPVLMEGSLNRHHFSGTVNGGGPTIRATTGSGDITIH